MLAIVSVEKDDYKSIQSTMKPVNYPTKSELG